MSTATPARGAVSLLRALLRGSVREAWRTLRRALPTLAGVLVINFCLLQLVPGDAVDAMVAESGSGDAETTAQLRAHFGLDRPAAAQLLDYAGHLAHLSLGWSPRYGVPVIDVIAQRLPSTLLLMALAFTLSVVAGIALGAVMASSAGRWPDRLLSALAFLMVSTPGFWLGLMGIVLFAVKLGWLPSGGSTTLGADLEGPAALRDLLWHAVLPVATLASFQTAVHARLTRAAMVDVAAQDYVRTARAKGLAEIVVLYRHVLRNALIPIVTSAGSYLPFVFLGSLVFESFFGLPGLGAYVIEAITKQDFAIVRTMVFLGALLYIATYVLIDVVYTWVDPRVRLG